MRAYLVISSFTLRIGNVLAIRRRFVRDAVLIRVLRTKAQVIWNWALFPIASPCIRSASLRVLKSRLIQQIVAVRFLGANVSNLHTLWFCNYSYLNINRLKFLMQ